jgi:murein DD-endopeptidase MepM/ murein hydrolase activator NlpD
VRRLIVLYVAGLSLLTLTACGTLSLTRVEAVSQRPQGRAPGLEPENGADADPSGRTQGSGEALWQDLLRQVGEARAEGSGSGSGEEGVDDPQVPAGQEPSGEASGEAPGSRPTATPSPCSLRTDWPTYVVKAGDTLAEISRQTGSSIAELSRANCLADPNVIRPAQLLYVPRAPAPTATPSPTPGAVRTVRHLDPEYQVAFDYPANWRSESGEGGRRFAGDDGFVQLDAVSSAHDLGEVAQEQAEHSLLPYGSQPTIEEMVLSDGRQARLILPSADQSPSMEQQALLLVPYADPVVIGGQAYNFMAMAADVDHIRGLAASLTLASAPSTIGIESFSVSAVDLADGAKRVTFHWRSYGATHAIITSGTARRLAPWWPLLASGQFTVVLEDTRLPNPEMLLQVRNAVSGREAYASTTLSWPCRQTYFFSPAPDYCPRDATLNTAGAFQPFQSGFMVWLQQPGSATPSIYVFQADGQVRYYPDNWSPDGGPGDTGETPPEGLYRPERGFGKVWQEQPQIRQALGWATARESSYQISYQAEARESLPGVAYLTLPDTSIVTMTEAEWAFFDPSSGS